MHSPSIREAVAKATPDVAELLDRHARWCAQMCRNVPPAGAPMFQNVPSDRAMPVSQAAKTFPNLPKGAGMFHVDENCKTNPIPPSVTRDLPHEWWARQPNP